MIQILTAGSEHPNNDRQEPLVHQMCLFLYEKPVKTFDTESPRGSTAKQGKDIKSYHGRERPAGLEHKSS